MKSPAAILLSVTFAAHIRITTATWPYGWPDSWKADWEANSTPSDEWFTSPTCNTSHLTAFEMVRKSQPVWLSTSRHDHPEAPHVLPPNRTTAEQWEFDGASDDGLSSFMFGFHRDPNYAILGSGNLRVSIEIAFANGTNYAHVDYPTDNIIETCVDGMQGLWKDDEEGYVYHVQVSADMSRARIGIDHPNMKGNIFLKSRTPPRYADASTWPSETALTEIVPFYHWFEAMPVGDIEVDLVVNGEPFVWSGMAGHERFWSAFSWFSCLQGLNAVRAKMGPYSLTWLSFISNIKKGTISHSAFLVEDGEVLLQTQIGNSNKPDVKDDYVIVEKKYDGRVAGTLKHKITGYHLEFVSPRRQKHWTFNVEHMNVGFEFMLGGGNGGVGFSGLSQGGHIGLKQHKGTAWTEALSFPEKSPLFKTQYSIKDEL